MIILPGPVFIVATVIIVLFKKGILMSWHVLYVDVAKESIRLQIQVHNWFYAITRKLRQFQSLNLHLIYITY